MRTLSLKVLCIVQLGQLLAFENCYSTRGKIFILSADHWNIVTGASGYTGEYITRRLLSLEEKVKTLTGHPDRPNPFGNQVPVLPFSFDDPNRLVENLQGVKWLFNTYWIRFPHGKATYDAAIENTKILLQSAKTAGVQKFIHISIANPDEHSPWPYYRGKALLEKEIKGSGLSYAIIRPTVIFGPEDILINNIAWCLRRFPIFAIPGGGDYRLQPAFVEDVARMAVESAQGAGNVVMDAVGPEVFTFRQLVELLARKLGSKTRIVHVSPGLALLCCRFMGYLTGDILLTKEELEGLMQNLLVSAQPPTGQARLSDWPDRNASTVGRMYASELQRHFER